MSESKNETVVLKPIPPVAPVVRADGEVLSLGGRKGGLVPGDVVNRETSKMSDRARTLIRWVHAHQAERQMSNVEIASKLRKSNGTGYSDDSYYQLITGRRDEGTMEPMLKAIEDYKALEEKRGEIVQVEFVQTSLAKEIWTQCELALTYQRFCLVIGDSQIGKTAALQEYQRTHNHGQTVYVRMPAGGAMMNFLPKLAKALRISARMNNSQLRQRIISAFDDRMLLIVDEAHQSLMGTERLSSYQVLEFVREIFDESGCGVVLAGTDVLPRVMASGKYKEVLGQVDRRKLVTKKLPSVPRKADLNTFAKHFALAPAEHEALDLQTEVTKYQGLGMWLTLLRAASRMAAKEKAKALTWDHVARAHATMKRMEGGAE